MKKITILLVALLMVLICSPVYAETEEPKGTNLDGETSSGDVEIGYEVEETYSVTIPASFDLTGEETYDGTTKDVNFVVNSCNIQAGRYLEILLSSKNDWHLKNGESTIPYVIENLYGDWIGDEDDEDNPYFLQMIYNAPDCANASAFYGKYKSSNGNCTSVSSIENEGTTLKFFFEDGAFAKANDAGRYEDTLTFTCSIKSLELKNN